MKVLIIGGGGREHALAWKCAQSPLAGEVIVAPGNAGTELEPGVRNAAVDADDADALLDLARREDAGLTIVGPEAPLVAGVVDRFRQAGLPCLGPEASAARLEGSKDFAKRFFRRHGIPTADFRSFTDLAAAENYLREQGAPIVVKADGLAAGKGVVVAESTAEALQAARDMLAGNRFGQAGARIVVEECLSGEEASFIVLTDGESVVPLASSQDHKARDDGDTGPNTGGMGAYSPAPLVTPDLESRITSEVIEPTLRGLAAEGIPYTGFLYAGLMVSSDGTPRVLEFNCRFGDPETQPIMARLRSDLVDLCLAALTGDLGKRSVEWDPRAALGVVMASGGYPGTCETGKPISGLDDAARHCKVFHAATAQRSGEVVTAGGRVLCAVGMGEGVREARQNAYRGVDSIHWDGEFHRNDIGYRALQREC